MKNSPKQELGEKCIPQDKATTAKAAIQFAAKGIISLKEIPAPIQHPVSGESVIPLPEAEVIGRVSIGNLLFAQGLELIFKLIFMAEEIEDKGYKQHCLSERFEKIRTLCPLQKNIEKFMPQHYPDRAEAALEVVKIAEDAFMISRYLGLRSGNLKSINPIDAAGLLMSLTVSYKGLEQVEAARLIGISIKNVDGTPLNEPFTRLTA